MNIHLICSDSFRLIDKEIKKIVSDEPVISFNMAQSSIKDILEEANYFGFDVSKKYIVVRNASIFGTDKSDEEDVKRLMEYMSHPNPNSTIIFTTNTIDSRKKHVKYIKEHYHLLVIPSWDKKRTRDEIVKYLDAFGYKIDYETMTYLIDNSYNNIDILFNELDKIMLYYHKACPIALKDVEKIVGGVLDGNTFHFIDAVVNKDLEKSLTIMNSLKIYKVESIQLINLLAREYRLMYFVKRKMWQGKNSSVIGRELNLQDWQVSKLYTNSNKYSEKELLHNLYMLGKIDLKIKNGTYDKDIALYPFLLEACI